MFDWYPEYEYRFACVQLVLFMLGMGATLSWADFARVIHRPKFLLIAAACHLIMVPVLAVLINTLAGLEAGIAIGLVLIAAMPGGALSKAFTYLGRGNLALSIAMSVCFTLGTLVTVPLFLRLLAAEYVPSDFEMPVGWIIRDVAVFSLLPLLIGMTIARLAPARREVFARWCIRIGFVTVIVMVAGSLGSGRISPGEQGWRVALAIILFCVLAQQLTMVLFRVARWPVPDRCAVGIEMTMRNINLALLLKALIFPATQGADPLADGVLFVILFYAGVALPAGCLLALNHRRVMRNLDRAALAA